MSKNQKRHQRRTRIRAIKRQATLDRLQVSLNAAFSDLEFIDFAKSVLRGVIPLSEVDKLVSQNASHLIARLPPAAIDKLISVNRNIMVEFDLVKSP